RSASRKVVRGGAWETTAFMLRPSSRKVFYPGYRIEGVGFRCAADLK
ncbi:MAG: formylglycine-generating enzyme family protein, partial [Nitrospina sp.]